MARNTAMPTIYPLYAWRIVRSSALLWLFVRLALIAVSRTLRLTFGARSVSE